MWTQMGPVDIQKVSVGDLVLSQDPISGQLDYRPVTDTTVRRPSAIVKLTLDEEEISATRGHRFWVTGDGWQMAKFLSAGDLLFSPRGSGRLQSINEAAEAPAYNLMVDEFHTYFVGQSMLLVHDNACPEPTTVSVPGSKVIAADPIAAK